MPASPLPPASPRPLRQLVYGSAASQPITEDDLVQILRASRRNNHAVGVTGALLYADGNFLQVLEGEPSAVDGVYRRVCEDARHRGVLTLYDARTPERTFPDWSMGLIDPDGLAPDDRAVARSLYDLTTPSPGAARRLMGSFRSMMPGVRTTVNV